MSSKVPFKKTGSVKGAGADKKVVLGFKPQVVEVYNVTDGIKSKKLDSMPLLKAVSEAADGATTYADHIQINSDGFTIKAALAVAGKELHYCASELVNE